jgi:Tol biopolymer transport system component
MQVTRGDGYYELADISRDGEKVFYWFWQGNSDIFGVRTETGEEFELASEIQSELWADVSPDGSRVVFQSNNSPRLTPNIAKSSLFIKTLENASAPPLVLKGHSPHFLPDSRRVAFLRLNREEMKYQYWLVNAASGEEKQLTVEGVSPPAHSRLPINREDTGKNFSPDASRFVFLDSKKQNIWMASVDAAETSNLTDNTNPNVRYHPPVWSPDGKRITFLSSEKTEDPKTSLRLYEQGKLKEIYSTKGSLHLLGFSASGNEILLAMTDGIMRSTPLEVKLLQVSITGESRILNVFKDIYAWSLTLSDDGKRLAFTARRDERDNIWMAAVSGGEPKKLTANSPHRIFYGSPAWSADGKVIFFDKQDQINTISMFENFK